MTVKKVTFADIARYTNFSKTTISRYFNNPNSLTEKNRQIISDALIKLDYHENKLAKVLAQGSTEFIGIIIPNLYLHYYSAILENILNSYQEYNYKFLVFVGHEDINTERQYIKELLSYNIEGLIILSHTIPSEELASYKIPIVSIERESCYISSVDTDNYLGAVQATSHLIKNKCDILVHINSLPKEDMPAFNRITGFEEVCQDSDIPYLIYNKDLGATHENISKNLSHMLDDLEEKYPYETKGIFLANDTYASVFLNLIIRKFGELPDKYQIVGFDDSPIATESIVPLTTIQQKIPTLTQYAMEILSQEIYARKNKLSSEIVHREVPPVLVKRETTH
ncbi:LacI family DNA-binding transcriptional regulator [Streptococcus merionis]|uniref:LacI family DNA-binding transcriptional regulator n=1 Tax=Streptococcus merionis TaxID=400065 RepID=UPI003518415E